MGCKIGGPSCLCIPSENTPMCLCLCTIRKGNVSDRVYIGCKCSLSTLYGSHKRLIGAKDDTFAGDSSSWRRGRRKTRQQDTRIKQATAGRI